MIRENLYFGDDARKKLMAGVSKVARAVGITLGTSGSNSLIECIESPKQFSTNDGYTIANSILLRDPLEDMGRKILLEAINRANKASGDGSSTTCVLTSTILEEGMKHLGEASPMEIKRSLEACIPLIEKSIKAQTRPITLETVGQVASISAEDESIGSMIQEIYQKIGKDGIINWEASKTAEDSYTIGTGLKVDGATYFSRSMCDMVPSGFLLKATLENPHILLARQKISSSTEIDNLLQSLSDDGTKELVIFCEEMEVSLINTLVMARQQIGFRVLVVKMPVLWADEWWEDLSAATGARLIDSTSGIKLQQIGYSRSQNGQPLGQFTGKEFLGTCERIVVDRENTYLDGIADLTRHILGLKVENTDESLLRASRLNTKTARYLVGGHSESALKYRILKVEDAINAASCALEHGIVAGGGVALRRAALRVEDKNTVGGKILSMALLSPYFTILNNADIEAPINAQDSNNGADSRSGKSVNMFDAGIIDPSDVVLNAVRNAIGVAASILTVGTIVTLPREEK